MKLTWLILLFVLYLIIQLYINLTFAYHKTINCTIILYTIPRWLTLKRFKFISPVQFIVIKLIEILLFFVTGPSTWVSKFPMAAGSRQSPVNIETDKVESDHEALSSKPLRWKYPATASRKLVNPGYCWRMDTDGEGTCKFLQKFSFIEIFKSIKRFSKSRFIVRRWIGTKIFKDVWKKI